MPDDYLKAGAGKLNSGKCSIRFKKPDEALYKLPGQLAKKITVAQGIAAYEKSRPPKQKKA